MPGDDDRRELFDLLEPSLGSRGAALLMAHLPPVGWADLATKADLGALRSEMLGEMAKLEGKVDAFRFELKGEIGELRGELGELRGELKGELAELRGELASQVPKLWAANVATMFGIAGLVLAVANFVN